MKEIDLKNLSVKSYEALDGFGSKRDLTPLSQINNVMLNTFEVMKKTIGLEKDGAPTDGKKIASEIVFSIMQESEVENILSAKSLTLYSTTYNTFLRSVKESIKKVSNNHDLHKNKSLLSSNGITLHKKFENAIRSNDYTNEKRDLGNNKTITDFLKDIEQKIKMSGRMKSMFNKQAQKIDKAFIAFESARSTLEAHVDMTSIIQTMDENSLATEIQNINTNYNTILSYLNSINLDMETVAPMDLPEYMQKDQEKIEKWLTKISKQSNTEKQNSINEIVSYYTKKQEKMLELSELLQNETSKEAMLDKITENLDSKRHNHSESSRLAQWSISDSLKSFIAKNTISALELHPLSSEYHSMIDHLSSNVHFDALDNKMTLNSAPDSTQLYKEDIIKDEANRITEAVKVSLQKSSRNDKIINKHTDALTALYSFMYIHNTQQDTDIEIEQTISKSKEQITELTNNFVQQNASQQSTFSKSLTFFGFTESAIEKSLAEYTKGVAEINNQLMEQIHNAKLEQRDRSNAFKEENTRDRASGLTPEPHLNPAINQLQQFVTQRDYQGIKNLLKSGDLQANQKIPPGDGSLSVADLIKISLGKQNYTPEHSLSSKDQLAIDWLKDAVDYDKESQQDKASKTARNEVKATINLNDLNVDSSPRQSEESKWRENEFGRKNDGYSRG